LEFMAEKELVEIVPKFSLDMLCLLEGTLGPFRAGLPIRVPLWVAMDFRRRERCTLVPPHWMNTVTLEQLKNDEKNEPKRFIKMPTDNYMAVSNIIFRACAQDIPEADKVQILVKDIWDNRVSKLRTAVLEFIDKGATWAKMDNLTQMEMATVRPFFPEALEHLHRIRESSEEAAREAEHARRTSGRSQSQLFSDSHASTSSQSQQLT